LDDAYDVSSNLIDVNLPDPKGFSDLLEYECGGDPADDEDDECGSIKEF
jgi:hypothetical protein